MSSKKKPYPNGIYVPWYGYFMIFMVYATPFIMMTPIALLTGILSNEEFAVIFGNPILNILTVFFVGVGAGMTFMLRKIIKGYNGGPVGLDTLASAIGEEAVTLEDMCEPFLMQLGFLARTPRGRCATKLAYEHLGFATPDDGENGKQLSF